MPPAGVGDGSCRGMVRARTWACCGNMWCGLGAPWTERPRARKRVLSSCCAREKSEKKMVFLIVSTSRSRAVRLAVGDVRIGLRVVEQKATYSIGLDLGGTNLRAAAVDREGRRLDWIERPTMAHEGREAIVSAMVEAIDAVRRRRGTAEPAGIGSGAPGVVSAADGVIRNS